MRRSVVLEPEAEDEARAAGCSYERQRAGLGAAFLAELDVLLGRLASLPSLGIAEPGRAGDLGARSIALRRFPFRIVYVSTTTHIVVVAVAHASRRPGYWFCRLGRSDASERGG